MRTDGNPVNASSLTKGSSSNTRGWDGDIAEILIYNTALSPHGRERGRRVSRIQVSS